MEGITNIFWLSVMTFVGQFLFLFFRTLNVKAITNGKKVLASLFGGAIHILWLITIAIGADSTHKIITNFELEHSPVVICSLVGSVLGQWVAMSKRRKKKRNGKDEEK